MIRICILVEIDKSFHCTLTRVILDVFDLIKDFLLTKLNDLTNNVIDSSLKRNRGNRNDIPLRIHFTSTTKCECANTIQIDLLELAIIHNVCSSRRIRNQKNLCIRILQERNGCIQNFLKVERRNIRCKCITYTRQLRIDQCIGIFCRKIFRLHIISSIRRLHVYIGDIEILEEAFQCILRKFTLNISRSCCFIRLIGTEVTLTFNRSQVVCNRRSHLCTNVFNRYGTMRMICCCCISSSFRHLNELSTTLSLIKRIQESSLDRFQSVNHRRNNTIEVLICTKEFDVIFTLFCKILTNYLLHKNHLSYFFW